MTLHPRRLRAIDGQPFNAPPSLNLFVKQGELPDDLDAKWLADEQVLVVSTTSTAETQVTAITEMVRLIWTGHRSERLNRAHRPSLKAVNPAIFEDRDNEPGPQ